jgi:dephospho-CoA kinase
MLVLIIGYACTGKSTLRSFLEENGILAIEASSFIAPLRQDCRKKGVENIYEIFPKSIGAELIKRCYGDQLERERIKFPVFSIFQ